MAKFVNVVCERPLREHQIANYTSRDKVASQETDRNGSHNELPNLIVYI